MDKNVSFLKVAERLFDEEESFRKRESSYIKKIHEDNWKDFHRHKYDKKVQVENLALDDAVPITMLKAGGMAIVPRHRMTKK